MSPSEKHAIALATNNFYDALNALFVGDFKPMQQAWSHAEDICYMGPEGLYLIGWDKIGKMWEQVAEMKLGGAVKPMQLHTVFSNEMAMITCVETGENEVEGKFEQVGIRSSTVFRKENNQWLVIAHQTDLLSFMK